MAKTRDQDQDRGFGKKMIWQDGRMDENLCVAPVQQNTLTCYCEALEGKWTQCDRHWIQILSVKFGLLVRFNQHFIDKLSEEEKNQKVDKKC